MNDPFKTYRARFRLWRNRARLVRENRYYAERFYRLGLSVPDDATLKAAFQQRFPDVACKPKGELRTIAVYRHHNWEHYSLAPALQRFGPVRHFDWSETFAATGRQWRDTVKAEMNEALESTLNRWIAKDRPDVIFMYVSGETVDPALLSRLREARIPMVNLALNDKEHFVGKIRGGLALGAKDICRHFDLCWTSTADALIKYCVEGARPIHLPEGANPDIHKPYDLEKTIDVSFVGQRYGNREAVIGELRKRGIDVRAYGFGWPDGPLSVHDMVKLYSQTRINLGFGGIEGHRDTFCLKGRDFEIPMSGGLYLTEDHPELHLAFQPGVDILTYTGIDELEAKVRYYLSHPEEAEAIRRQGRRRALLNHTWEARFETIFRLLGLMR